MLSKMSWRSLTNSDSCLEGGRRVGGRIEINGSPFSDAEIAAVANYVTSRFGSKGSQLTAQDVAELQTFE
jgi:mono/diheme cytochrome c family protein